MSVDDLVIKKATEKIALYWKSQDRKYKQTKKELSNNQYLCPKCGNLMKKKTYKMKSKLLICANGDCLFMIKSSDVLDGNTDLLENKYRI